MELPRRTAVVGLAACLVLMASLAVQAQQATLPPAATRTINFADDIQPLIEGRCQACHGPQLQSNGLRLDSRDHLLKGGYAGPAVVPGNSAESKLIRMVAGLEQGIVMPPAGEKLTAQEIGLLRAWIDQGAEWPATTAEAAPESPATTSADLGTTHWSFQPVERPSPPAVNSHQWAKSPIDHFVLARLEKEGIEPSPLAGPERGDGKVAPRRVALTDVASRSACRARRLLGLPQHVGVGREVPRLIAECASCSRHDYFGRGGSDVIKRLRAIKRDSMGE